MTKMVMQATLKQSKDVLKQILSNLTPINQDLIRIFKTTS